MLALIPCFNFIPYSPLLWLSSLCLHAVSEASLEGLCSSASPECILSSLHITLPPPFREVHAGPSWQPRTACCAGHTPTNTHTYRDSVLLFTVHGQILHCKNHFSSLSNTITDWWYLTCCQSWLFELVDPFQNCCWHDATLYNWTSFFSSLELNKLFSPLRTTVLCTHCVLLLFLVAAALIFTLAWTRIF